MKRNATLWIGFLSLVMIVLLSSFEKETIRPLQLIQKNYHNGLNDFQQKIRQLEQTAQKLTKQPKTIEQLQTDFKNTRYAYKQIEHLIAFLDIEGVKYHINGAPLPKLEQNVPEITVLEPSGLQTIDEIVFSKQPANEKQHLIQLIKDLDKEYAILKNIQQTRSFTDRQVFEAIRFQLIRILALGITGFDTPASLNALPEAAVSLKSMQKTLQIYFPYLEAKAPKLIQKTNTTFDKAIQYLKDNNDFDNFDRLHFTKTFINPLFKLVLDIHLKLGIETIYETTSAKLPVNFLAENIFDKDFLNKYYYIRLIKSQDTKALQALGRTLFFDPVLSKNNERACASCHQPQLAFTDGLDKSIAFDFKGKINRNAPTLINSIFAERFFYDLRAKEFDLQVEHVVHAHDEFNTDYTTIINKLNKSKTYQQYFEAAFDKTAKSSEGIINSSTINTAIVAYVKELIGYNSEFDQYVRGEAETYPAAAQRGFNLFMGKAACGTCHFAPTFSGLVPPDFVENEAEVIGVPATSDTLNPAIDSDKGKAGSGRIREIAPYHEFAFKTTTARNSAVTAPYMHNGVYQTLEEVVDFYNKGGGQGLGIELPNQTLPFDNLNLTQTEQADIVAFLKTLTDKIDAKQPDTLPHFPDAMGLNERVIGGKY